MRIPAGTIGGRTGARRFFPKSSRTSPMATDPEGSVTRLIGALVGEDTDAAAEQLWRRYFDQLVRLAQSRLRAAPRGAGDEEDVALSAFDSFCRGAVRGRFPRLGDRGD